MRRRAAEKGTEFDYIVTPEAKSIPLAYEMSRQSGKNTLWLARALRCIWTAGEGNRPFHHHPKEQTLYLGHEDGDLLDGKRVLLLDDVISTETA